MTDRRLQLTAIALAALGAALVVVGLVLGLARGDEGAGLLDFVDDIHWFLSYALFVPVGALIAWRQTRNPVGWLLLAIGLGQVAWVASYEYAAQALVVDPGSLPGGDTAAWISAWAWAPSICLFPLVMILFPTGRALSSRWRWVGRIPLVWMAVFFVLAAAMWPYRGARLLTASGEVGVPQLERQADLVLGLFPIVLLSLAVALVSIVVRFRRSTGTERQQLKWIALAAGAGAANIVVFDVVLLELGFESRIVTLVAETVTGPGIFPIVAAIAILRHRLFDIDVVINRTLVYASLTAMLAGAYFALVVLLQRVLAPVSEDSDLAVAGSTLVVAALFRPLRSRVQSFIDRRFYRRKYDASETLEEFSGKLRDEVDLDEVQRDLVDVVATTMQPVHASLWLRGGEQA